MSAPEQEKQALRYAFPDGEMGRWASLGAVTDSSVRLWYRDPDCASVTAVLRVDGEVVAEASVAPAVDHDGIATADLVLDQPRPDSAFSVEVGDITRPGQFAPAEGAPARFSFVFGSCNHPFLSRPGEEGLIRNPANGIYRLMKQALARNDARFMLFSGDQIYADGTAHLDVPAYIRENADDLSDTDLLDLYRHLYRGYFNESSYRALLEATPAYFTWDDHEIFDDWGSRPDATEVDRRIFRAAETAYREYQHLHNPGSSLNDQVPHAFNFWMGDTGFFVLDTRGERDFDREQVLGEKQWSRLGAFLESAASRDASSVFVVSTIPLVHFAPRLIRLLDRLPGSKGNDVRDRWDSRQFLDDRNRLLETLFDWQSARPGRQAVLLSGDVHAGAAFKVHRKDRSARISQWTASALTTPAGLLEKVSNHAGTRLVNWGETTCHSERVGLETRNNFGLVEVRPRDGGGPGHEIALTVFGYNPRKRALRRRVRATASPR